MGQDELRAAIQRERALAGCSQQKLADALGVDSATLSKKLSGKSSSVHLDDIPPIEDAIGLPRGFLLRAAGYVEDPHDVEKILRFDPAISEGRSIVLEVYRAAKARSAARRKPRPR